MHPSCRLFASLLTAYNSQYEYCFLSSDITSYTWCLGRAAVCDCGIPWTFLLPFFHYRLYVCSVCACLDLSVSSSSWGLGRAAVCDCGTPWTFLLPFCFPRLRKRDLILVLFVRLFDLCLFGFVGFLFLLVSGRGCGLWLWHSLDFSLFFLSVIYLLPVIIHG